MEVALYTSSWITIISFYRLNFASFLWKWKKVKVTSDSHGILQARTLEWKAFPFSRGSSQSRNQTQVSCIAGRFFTSWATRKSKNTGVDSLFPLQQKSQPRNRTGVSFLAGGFFTNWALRKAQGSFLQPVTLSTAVITFTSAEYLAWMLIITIFSPLIFPVLKALIFAISWVSPVFSNHQVQWPWLPIILTLNFALCWISQ